MDRSLHRRLSLFCPVYSFADAANQKAPLRSGERRSVFVHCTHRRDLVDDRAKYLWQTILCELDCSCRIPWNRRYLVGSVLEKFGKETACAVE